MKHPNWKPNPNVHRPKYVMNREEAVQKVDFACQFRCPAIADRLLQKAEVELPPPIDRPSA